MTNIIVLVIDTLRRDHVGVYGNDWIQTPNLDRLAARSWVFDRSYAGSFPTIPHRLDAMTGRYGGPFHPWRPLAFDVTTLPQALGEMGYATQLIHDTPHLVNGGHNFDWPFNASTSIRGGEADRPWVTDRLDWLSNWKADPIFDAVGPPKDLPTVPTMATYACANRNRRRPEDWTAARLFHTASEFLIDNARQEGFFLWIDCFDPHEPWEAPAEFMRMYDQTPGYDGSADPRIFTTHHATIPEAVGRRIKAGYAAKVSWVDHCLGALLNTLEQTGLAERTAIVVTADHGTNLGEWGVYGKTWPVREFEAHTPLVVHAPRMGSGRSDAIVQPQDLFATVMGLAGGRAPEDVESYDVLAAAREGRSTPRRFALSGTSADSWSGEPNNTFALFEEDWCLILAARTEDCRLVRTGSQEDVSAEHPDLVRRMRETAIDEIARRGAEGGIVDWLRSEGRRPIPADCPLWDGWPGPSGYKQYWTRLYEWKKTDD